MTLTWAEWTLSWLQTVASTGATFMAMAGVTLYWQQRSIIYPANVPSGSREQVDLPSQHGMDTYEELYLDTPDGMRLHAFWIQQPDLEKRRNAPTVLYCHANAGNMGHRLPIAKIFHRKFDSNVLMFSYRGYGKSTGEPSEAGLRVDAETALEFLWKQPAAAVHPAKIVVFGQSIGGAVAIDLVARQQDRVRALIVENTFTSIPKLIPTAMPIAKHFTFLCTEHWPSEERIRAVDRVPALFLAGTRDELVPHTMMKRLYELAPTTRKQWSPILGGTHNDTCVLADYWAQMQTFWETNVQQ